MVLLISYHFNEKRFSRTARKKELLTSLRRDSQALHLVTVNKSSIQLNFCYLQRLSRSKVRFRAYICSKGFIVMENQYCKVGTVTPITSNRNVISLLEYQYQTFLNKASDMKYTDAKLVEFFEQKAEKIQRVLENMMK